MHYIEYQNISAILRSDYLVKYNSKYSNILLIAFIQFIKDHKKNDKSRLYLFLFTFTLAL